MSNAPDIYPACGQKVRYRVVNGKPVRLPCECRACKQQGGSWTVLTWRYSDNSGGGVIRVYEDEQQARTDMAMLAERCDSRVFDVCDVPFVTAV